MPKSKVRIRSFLAPMVAGLAAVLCSFGTLAVLAPPPASAAAAGPSWNSVQGPVPSNAANHPFLDLAQDSCASPGNCVAVGDYHSASGYEYGVIETESGGSWTAVQAPLPANSGTEGHSNEDSALSAVSCTSPTSCVAVGRYEDNVSSGIGYNFGLIETLANGTWSASAAPEPSNSGTDADHYQDAELSFVDCPAVGTCTAAGGYQDTLSYDYGLIDTLSNGTWQTVSAPQPSNGGDDADHNQDVELDGLSCSSASFCSIVGSYNDSSPSGYQFGLIETGSGTNWTPTSAPEPANAGSDMDFNQFAELLGVSCSSDGNCAAGGDYDGTDGYQWGMVEVLSNGSWSATSTPVPPGAGTGSNQFAESDAIDCPTDGNCVSIGVYKDNQGRIFGLINTLAAGGWAGAQAPEPAGADTNPADSPSAQLNGISCSWPGQCETVGYYPVAGGDQYGYIDTLSGGSWSSITAPMPSNAVANGDTYLENVDCTAAFCVTDGRYADATTDQAVLDTFSGTGGYDLVASDGGLFSYNVPFFGSMGGQPLNEPVVGMAMVPSNDGYYEVASDGGIFAFNAPFYGSMGGKPLNKPIVGIAFDSRTGGYYEVASDGGIFAFNAPFFGSMGGQPLNKPIVGIAFDPMTGGYYEVASDGGLFAFNAPFLGSTGNLTLNKPVVGMTVDTNTGGYYEVASDGGLFAYGAPFQGSMGGQPLNKPVVGMAFDYQTGGYFEVATDGGLFAFNAPFQGSTGNLTLNKPVVGMTVG